MKLNISYPANGSQKLIEIDDERKLRAFMEKRMGAEVPGDSLGDEFKGYVCLPFSFAANHLCIIQEPSTIRTFGIFLHHLGLSGNNYSGNNRNTNVDRKGR